MSYQVPSVCTTDRRVLALDRRVDVYSSWVSRRIRITEPVLIRSSVRRVSRITRRTFSKFAPRNLAARPEPGRNGFREGVRMEKTYDLEITGMAEIASWRAEITYEWGEPQPQVMVHETVDALRRVTRSRRSVARGEADQSPILNPPDP
jgi:hypothetical protein